MAYDEKSADYQAWEANRIAGLRTRWEALPIEQKEAIKLKGKHEQETAHWRNHWQETQGIRGALMNLWRQVW